MVKKSDQKITIIIVTFESAKIISSCLNKINLNKYQVFVVDNNSQDNTSQIVQENFPQVHLIKLKQNIGYGRANNVALSQVQTDYALILNPDAFLEEKDIDSIIELLDKNKDFALAAPLLLNHFPAQNNEIEEQIEIVKGNLIEEINGNFSVKYVIGAIVFLKMSVFKKIGFYDEETFMFYEDDEICHRVIKNGYKCVINADSYGFHVGGGSSKRTFRTIYKRNLHMYLSKLRWKQKQKGYFNAFKSALRLVFINIFAAFFNLFLDRQKLAVNLGFTSGCLCFLLGLKAFKKNGEARG